jgi:hypothetical protein
MAAAVFPGVGRPELVRSMKARSFPSLPDGKATLNVGDLTIHRITQTHHGRTLLTLGHAAEYLTNSRRYSTRVFDRQAEIEAVHLLMGLSREVFEDFAEQRSLNVRFADSLVEGAVRLAEKVPMTRRNV